MMIKIILTNARSKFSALSFALKIFDTSLSYQINISLSCKILKAHYYLNVTSDPQKLNVRYIAKKISLFETFLKEKHKSK